MGDCGIVKRCFNAYLKTKNTSCQKFFYFFQTFYQKKYLLPGGTYFLLFSSQSAQFSHKHSV